MKYVIALFLLFVSFVPVSAFARGRAVSRNVSTVTKNKTLKTKRSKISTNRHLGQCVVGVNRILGRRVIQGWAGAIKPKVNPRNLKVGMVILTKEGRGHVGIIAGDTGTHWKIHESNYHLDGMETLGRLIPKSSYLIRGGISV